MPRKPKRRAVIAQCTSGGVDLYDSESGRFLTWLSTTTAMRYFGIEVEPGEAVTLMLNPPRVVRRKRKPCPAD